MSTGLTLIALLVALGSAWLGVQQQTNEGSQLSMGNRSAGELETADEREVVLVGAGDIAFCPSQMRDATATASLILDIPGVVFTLGDNAYLDGTVEEFAECYHRVWGEFKDRTRPAVGNHEYHTPGAAPYYAYFGAGAGDAGKGYYSYRAGGWLVIVLNSVCPEVGGCGIGNPQIRWLRTLLESEHSTCILAYWHHPLFGSGSYSPNRFMKPFWEALYSQGTTLVVNGHEHFYERFAPQDPNGVAQPDRGIRQITAGTGGNGFTELNPEPAPNSEVRNNRTHGVLKLTLRSDTYEWEFIPIPGGSFTDTGVGQCVRSTSAWKGGRVGG